MCVKAPNEYKHLLLLLISKIGIGAYYPDLRYFLMVCPCWVDQWRNTNNLDTCNYHGTCFNWLCVKMCLLYLKSGVMATEKRSYRNSSINLASDVFPLKNFCSNFGGKIFYVPKIIYFTWKLEGCVVCYSCILLAYWSHSHPFGFSWLHWALESVVRGYHVCMDNCSPPVGNEFELSIEELSQHDRNAAAIKVSDSIYGHVLCEFSEVL